MMKVVIDIDDNIYTRLFDNGVPVDLTTAINDAQDIATAIRNGTLLPEHHGRLIDADKLELDDGYSNYDGYYHKYSKSQIDKAPTVLEADKENKG